ncbi:hypothetical protein ABN584_12420 [Gloeocapsa sp. BRSZ]
MRDLGDGCKGYLPPLILVVIDVRSLVARATVADIILVRNAPSL